MRLKILVVSFLLVVSILCFIVVYIMHSNLSFIDYPYLYTGIFFINSCINYFFKKNRCEIHNTVKLIK